MQQPDKNNTDGSQKHPKPEAPAQGGGKQGAIEFLKAQHREIEGIFGALESKDSAQRAKKFYELADKLSTHLTVEEAHFYSALRDKQPKAKDGASPTLQESIDEADAEHIGIKRALSDVQEVGPDDTTFGAKVKALKEQVEHHVEEEERDTMPLAATVLDPAALRSIAERMSTMQKQIASSDPSSRMRDEGGVVAH